MQCSHSFCLPLRLSDLPLFSLLLPPTALCPSGYNIRSLGGIAVYLYHPAARLADTSRPSCFDLACCLTRCTFFYISMTPFLNTLRVLFGFMIFVFSSLPKGGTQYERFVIHSVCSVMICLSVVVFLALFLQSFVSDHLAVTKLAAKTQTWSGPYPRNTLSNHDKSSLYLQRNLLDALLLRFFKNSCLQIHLFWIRIVNACD